MLKVFIGYDSREVAAFHTLTHSLMRHTTKPLAIIPLVQGQLRWAGLYTRETGATESTEFSLTRFLVPFLSDYKGYSIFMDCDMLVQTDIYEVMDLISSDMDVSVCKHDYTPKTKSKMDGKVQTNYPRKNWSSFMVFNNSNYACQHLTPEVVNNTNASYLQQLQWVEDERIGSLPLTWNWLVDEYAPNPDAHILHYTLGTPQFDPWFKEYVRLHG